MAPEPKGGQAAWQEPRQHQREESKIKPDSQRAFLLLFNSSGESQGCMQRGPLAEWRSMASEALDEPCAKRDRPGPSQG